MFRVVLLFILSATLMASAVDNNVKNVTKTDLNQSIKEDNASIILSKENQQKRNIHMSVGTPTQKSVKEQSFENGKSVWLPIVFGIFLVLILFFFSKLQQRGKSKESGEKFIKYIGITALLEDDSINNKNKNEIFGNANFEKEKQGYKSSSERSKWFKKNKKGLSSCILEWFKKNKDKCEELNLSNIKSTLERFFTFTSIVSFTAGFVLTYKWFDSHDGTNPVGIWSVATFSIVPFILFILAFGILIIWYIKVPSRPWKKTNLLLLIINLFKKIGNFFWDHIPTGWDQKLTDIIDKVKNEPKYARYRAIKKTLTDVWDMLNDKNDVKNLLMFSQINKMAVLFAIGSAMGILWGVSAGDFAVAWSADIQSTFFYNLFQIISLPWSSVWEAAVPTIEMIEKGHYHTIGGDGLNDLKEHAGILVQWWKFIFMSILFYGVLLRTIVFIFSIKRFKTILDDRIFGDLKSQKLLRQMINPTAQNEKIGNQKEDNTELNISLNIISWETEKDRVAPECDKRDLNSTEILNEDTWHEKSLQGDVYFFLEAEAEPTSGVINALKEIAEMRDVDEVNVFFILDEEYDDVPKSVLEKWKLEIKKSKISNIKVENEK